VINSEHNKQKGRCCKVVIPVASPLVLFEDPDVLDLRTAKLATVHLINATAGLMTLFINGQLPDAKAVLDAINAKRRTPLDGFEKPARTKKLHSYLAKPTEP
jgi:hypothetical protein